MRLLLAGLVLLHLALGAAMGLSVDEAHYLLYALHPAWSYFDHPPLVGWLQWPLVAMDAPVAVLRLLPGLFWLGTVWVAYRIAVQLAPPGQAAQAGAWTVVVLALAPLLHILGLGLLPDSLLMLWGALLMLQTLHLMASPRTPRLAPWLWLGLWLGLAGLSKYTAIFSALAVAACLLGRHGLGLLRCPGPWVAALLALVLVLPVLLWNQQNHWISFVYQVQHGAGSQWRALDVLQFLLVQAVVYGPLLWWGASQARVAGSGRSLLWFFAIPFAVLAWLSGGGSSLPHWTAPAWVALAPLAGLGLARACVAGVGWGLRLLLLVQGAFCLLMLGLMLSGGGALMAAMPQRANGPNPFADLYGWDAAGARARSLAAAQHLDSLGVQNWTLASRIAWYARPLPVHLLEDRYNQFSLWAGELPVGGNSLLVDWSQMPYAVPLGPHGFADCQLRDTLAVTRWGYPLSTFRFYACHGWSGDPQPRLLEVSP